ncbi:F0F1 ATP synthase subunit epsilon [Bacteroides sp. 214]|uniref:F0F1 ATP synthase subunit epsilon n=1 Tax=Bacteroides sp. 214 TaxID=2302935 RepID=UPI0013D23F53|nr:F0F1 ATP synthase subunit epsilon [Bacteroides sp. 214]NDW12767.1 F0F1 ATP synthase subunit epsilon [Bacteroides sp. 214]
MSKPFHLNISSPAKEIYDGEVTSITLPGSAGSFNILAGHAPIVSSLKQGTLRYTTSEGKEQSIDIQDGFVEMSNGIASICIS